LLIKSWTVAPEWTKITFLIPELSSKTFFASFLKVIISQLSRFLKITAFLYENCLYFFRTRFLLGQFSQQNLSAFLKVVDADRLPELAFSLKSSPRPSRRPLRQALIGAALSSVLIQCNALQIRYLPKQQRSVVLFAGKRFSIQPRHISCRSSYSWRLAPLFHFPESATRRLIPPTVVIAFFRRFLLFASYLTSLQGNLRQKKPVFPLFRLS